MGNLDFVPLGWSLYQCFCFVIGQNVALTKSLGLFFKYLFCSCKLYNKERFFFFQKINCAVFVVDKYSFFIFNYWQILHSSNLWFARFIYLCVFTRRHKYFASFCLSIHAYIIFFSRLTDVVFVNIEINSVCQLSNYIILLMSIIYTHIMRFTFALFFAEIQHNNKLYSMKLFA